MELRVRLRQTCVASCAATALGFSLWSCGGAGPSRPTVTLPNQLPLSGPAAGDSSSLTGLTGTTIAWRCLTAGHAGIFSSATGCATATAAVHAQRRVAALAAPGASGNLAGSVIGSTVALTWLAQTSTDPATSYVIEAGSSSGASDLANFDTGNSATTFTTTGVPAGTYFVRVRARNSAGTSAASNEVVVTVGGGSCAGAPNAPSGLTSSASGSSVFLSWTAPASGCAAAGFVIEAGSTAGSSNLAYVNTGSTATRFSAAGVGAGTYYVRVRAANGSGTSGPSNEVTLIVGGGTPPSSSVTGRWVGVAPDGMFAEVNEFRWCPVEFDLQLDLTSSGNAVTGTAITRLRRVSSNRCGDVFGQVAAYSVIDGRIESGTISFGLGSGAVRFSGTVTGTRMTGTFVLTELSQPGTFAVNRQ
jgi:hypothetical protein